MKIKGRWEANKAAIKAMLNILVLWYLKQVISLIEMGLPLGYLSKDMFKMIKV
uniref:Uncharacterized protein n=2 Tax=Globisporangium ultimum (strain ATCC 200006 / CBS 805.95 / DAOM BR144) TaxID=431595 RepID=K3XCX6_GLOUD